MAAGHANGGDDGDESPGVTPPNPSPARPAAAGWRRWWPLALLLAALAGSYTLGLQRYLSFEMLAEHRAELAAAVAAHPAMAAAAFALAYVAVVAFSLPGGAVMSMAAGFLFGTVLGTAITVVAATAGACLLFMAARHALADTLAARAGPALEGLRRGLQQDGFWYLLSLRLLPVVPFWLANLAPALLGMRFAPYAAATAIGILPGSTVYVAIGAGLDQVLASGGRPALSIIFSPGILLPLVGLALLSLLGAWWRRRQRKDSPHG